MTSMTETMTAAAVQIGDFVRMLDDPQEGRIWRVQFLHRGEACLELAAGESMHKVRWVRTDNRVVKKWEE